MAEYWPAYWQYGTGSSTTTTWHSPWSNWVSAFGQLTTAATNATVAWSNWVEVTAYGDTGTTYVPAGPPMMYEHAGPPTLLTREQEAEQVRLANEALERHRRDVEERTARMKEADKRAEKLLVSLLDRKQRKELKETSAFTVHVETGSGPRSFRITRGRTGNVAEVTSDGLRVRQYCIHPRIECPDADTMAAQKLLLESDLDAFLRTANIS